MQQPEHLPPEAPLGNGPQPPSLLDYLEVLARRWKMIVGITLGAAIITAIITLFLPNIYTAKTMIIPGEDDKGGMGALMAQLGGLAAMAGAPVGAKTTGDLYVTMLKSEAIKDPIIDRFKLMERYKASYRVDVYKKLDTSAVITLGKKDGVITISVDEKDPKLAAELANAYVDELGRLTARLNMSKASDNRGFLEKRLAEAKAELARAEDALKAFQTEHKAISVTDQAKATIEGVAQLRAQLAVQEVQLGTLRQQFTDNSQEVKTAKSAIASLRGQIAGLEGKGGASSSIPNIGNMPQLGQEYLRLMRDFKIQEALLEMLTKQYEVAKVSEAKDTSPFSVLQKAQVPERKSRPARAKAVKVALFIALMGSVILALGCENWGRMDESTRTRLHALVQRFHRKQI